jgi:hypothetical protein
MQQLTYVKKRVLEWREAPGLTLHPPQEAIVRHFVAARCDCDIVPLFHNVTTPMKLGVAAQSRVLFDRLCAQYIWPIAAPRR